MNGIQDCGVEPIAYKRGSDLVAGDKVSTWWMPKGSVFIGQRPYTGTLRSLFPQGAFIGEFQKIPSPAAPKSSCEMTVDNSSMFAIMP